MTLKGQFGGSPQNCEAVSSESPQSRRFDRRKSVAKSKLGIHLRQYSGLTPPHGSLIAANDNEEEQLFPDPALRPTHKTVIDRRLRPVLRRAIAPPAAAFQHVHNAADNPAIIHPLFAPDIPWQMRFNPAPLLIRQSKPLAAHNSSLFVAKESLSHCQGKRKP